VIDDVKKISMSIKSESVHASAVVIVPKEKGSVKLQIPVRKEEDRLISEWEGEYMADAGYLKEDMLSTRQMAKFGHIIDLIETHTGNRIEYDDIPLDDESVMILFRKGHTGDVFHFGSKGLTTYLRHVKPYNVEDLIASIALYRPGAMKSNAHADFVKLRNGEMIPEYDYHLEVVTKQTLGLYIYQEQVMQAVQRLGNFTLSEADGVRKAMGKKIKHKMDGYKVQFVRNAQEKGCSLEEADKIWNKLEVFSGYGFNRSHAAAYSVI